MFSDLIIFAEWKLKAERTLLVLKRLLSSGFIIYSCTRAEHS